MPLKLLPEPLVLKGLGLEPMGEMHEYFTKRCADHADRFVPMDKGILRDYQIPQPDTILYEQEYAQYQWRGMRIDGTHVINEANRNRSKHPEATSHWIEKMWTLYKDDIVEEIKAEMKRRGVK